MDEQNTHFGYQQVASKDKEDLVAEVFHSVAARYDLMNDLMSLGIHRIWKHLTISNSGVRAGQQVLDLAGGTGDLTKAFSRRVGPQGQVVLTDINESMLQVGRDRMIDAGLVENIQYVLGNAEQLPFADRSFHCACIAFGLRNVTDKAAALQELYRVLRRGGRLLILEFSQPTSQWLQQVYDQYSFTVLPKLGKWITNDADSYQYLAESIRMHPDQDTLLQMLRDAGFERSHYTNMSGGIVALHCGVRLS